MAYPLTYPDHGDARFTGELLDDIADVLAAHGFPHAGNDDTDFAVLRTAIGAFLYGADAAKADNPVWWTDSNTPGGAR